MTEAKTLPAITPQPSSEKQRVLIADDDEKLAQALARALTSARFEVVVVGDGNQAIDAIVKSGFDVILADIVMPGTNGIDLLRVVRAYDLDVPVVLMTGSPDLTTAIEAIELGALQYLQKPFPLEEVVQAVSRAAKLHRLATLKRQALELHGHRPSEPGDLTGLSVSFDRAMESLWMAFQPIVSVRERRVMAYEALMRTTEPALPHPGAVLEAAERLNRLDELGRRIRALVAGNIPSAPANALIFVNVHAHDLLDADLASEDAPLSSFAERVVLEITERAALDNVKDVKARVEILRYMGFRIAIDDLGAGYAGLTSFATLEPEFVKLDMSLVRGIHTSEIRQKLVASVVSLCGEMKKNVIAEGIEVTEERDQLGELGSEWMQGYLFARPGKPFPSPVWD